PNTMEEVWPKETAVWKYSKDITEKYINEKRLYWGIDGLAKFPRVKLYLSEMDDVVPRSIWNYGDVGHTQQATNEIKELFSGEQVFDTPKPLKLLRRIVQLSSNKNDDIILDFFAGSGTTAHAIFEQNKEDGISRKSIIVQLPEVLLESNREQKAAYSFCMKNNLQPTISELTKERLRRAGKKVREDNPEWKGDVGFRVFKLDTSKEGANKQVISSQADSLIKISRIWADFFPANTSN
ncbi:site-specific DNA-methyltransferase, partial [Klebsiella variicola]